MSKHERLKAAKRSEATCREAKEEIKGLMREIEKKGETGIALMRVPMKDGSEKDFEVPMNRVKEAHDVIREMMREMSEDDRASMVYQMVKKNMKGIEDFGRMTEEATGIMENMANQIRRRSIEVLWAYGCAVLAVVVGFAGVVM